MKYRIIMTNGDSFFVSEYPNPNRDSVWIQLRVHNSTNRVTLVLENISSIEEVEE